jgi:5'-nucleotidase
MKSRRDFIKTVLIGGVMLGLDSTPLSAFTKNEYTKLTILHTNDTHSHIDPFPANDPKYPGLGGFARRAAMIKKIRTEEKNVLLFDSGDVVQGTPYYNMYGGEVEFKLMNEMKYDAMTIGNHEFDNGMEGLEKLIQLARFPMISANYDFSNTILNGKVEPFKIFIVDGITVGVFGLGVELKGLVNKVSCGETIYNDPLEKAAITAHLLKKDMKCDLVICLSHLGYSFKDDQVSDVVLSKQSKNIDLLLGGHSHTPIEKPYVFRNSDNEEIIICQEGWAGIMLGRIDYYMIKNRGIKIADAQTKKIKKYFS